MSSSLHRRVACVVLATVSACCWQTRDCRADESRKPIYFVEEHWEMVLRDPDPRINSPQVSFFVFPDRDDDSNFFELQMNYAAAEEYSSGGFRVTAYRDDDPIDHERGGTFQKLSIDNDRITWKTVLASHDSRFLFAIKDGHSADWGQFGGSEYLVEMTDALDVGLSRYHPRTSLGNVDIGFGANRVASITLRQVRVVYSDGTETMVIVNQTPTSLSH